MEEEEEMNPFQYEGEEEEEEEERDEEDPFGYEGYTSGLPIRVLVSDKFGGKGVFLSSSLSSLSSSSSSSSSLVGVDLWEEDPLFSWLLFSSSSSSLCSYDPLLSLLFRFSPNAKITPNGKKRKKNEKHSLFSPANAPPAPSFLFRLDGPRIYEFHPTIQQPIVPHVCGYCLKQLEKEIETCFCDCGDRFCDPVCREKAQTYSHICFKESDSLLSTLRQLIDFNWEYSAFQKGQITLWPLLLTYVHLSRKFDEFIEMECDQETAAYLALLPLSRFVTPVDSLCPNIDYNRASTLLKEFLCPFLSKDLLAAVPSLLSPSDIKERLGQLALNVHVTASSSSSSSSSSSQSTMSEKQEEKVGIIKEEGRGAGMYAILGCVNHSCDPNCEVVLTPTRSLVVRSLRPISLGEELTISYIPTELNYQERKKKLLQSFLISQCNCPLCILEGGKEENK